MIHSLLPRWISAFPCKENGCLAWQTTGLMIGSVARSRFVIGWEESFVQALSVVTIKSNREVHAAFRWCRKNPNKLIPFLNGFTLQFE